MKGTFLVSDTYASINSHRWCRNSEFAMDIGSFSADLAVQNIWGGSGLRRLRRPSGGGL